MHNRNEPIAAAVIIVAALVMVLYVMIIPARNFAAIERLEETTAALREENKAIREELRQVREMTTPQSMQDRTIRWILGGD